MKTYVCGQILGHFCRQCPLHRCRHIDFGGSRRCRPCYKWKKGRAGEAIIMECSRGRRAHGKGYAGAEGEAESVAGNNDALRELICNDVVQCNVPS